MAKLIKVRTLGNSTVREVTVEKARQILEDTYNDPQGGLVANANTGEIIWQLSPDVEEIVVIEQMIGGG
jgi:hypothetical protein